MRTRSYVSLGLLVLAGILLASVYFTTTVGAACWECSTSDCLGSPPAGANFIAAVCGITGLGTACCEGGCITEVFTSYCNNPSKYFSCTKWNSCKNCFDDSTYYCTQC